MTRGLIVAVPLALLLAGCAGADVVRVVPVFPEGDPAAARVSDLDIYVFAASDEVCRDLVAWRTAVCGRACTPPPIPAGATPIAVPRNADGTWTAARIEADGDRDIVVVVRDEEGEPVFYGCGTAGLDDTEIRLFRPWCDTGACIDQFHPACPVAIDCTVAPEEDPDRLGPPRCVPLAAVVWSFEQDGTSCEPTSGTLGGPCRPARIVCEPDRFVPVADGICPAAGATECGATLADDLDCDRSFPGPCGSCTPGTTARCGPPGGCAGISQCTASGTFGVCQLPDGTVETCDGTDEDCDGIPDDGDPHALAACNAGRVAGAPLADACAAGSCECGGGAPCAGTDACCGGACVDVTTDLGHCGRCNAACPSGLTCAGGYCVPAGCDAEVCGGGDEDCDGVDDTVDPDAIDDCNAAAPTRPVADACTAAGCRCGTSPACAAPRQCCGGRCVDTQTSDVHCGSCGNACTSGMECRSGTCRRCGPETCGRGDEDCDGVPDISDPDAVANCNEIQPPDAPIADACEGATCRCGGAAACTGGLACCGSVCVDITTDEMHCGGCGFTCAGTCVGGGCT
jgi:hypothetical protein